MITQEEASRRVARGLSWLNESGAKYGLDTQLIDPETLNISSHRRCVLAQAAGRSFILFHRDYAHQLGSNHWFAEHGFNLHTQEALAPYYHQDFNVLTEAWRKALHREERLRTAATLILAA